MKCRVWAEHLPPNEARSEEVLDLLRRYEICVDFAVHHGINQEIVSMLRTYDAAGLEVGLWPLLEESEGYWVSMRNIDTFLSYLDELLEALSLENVPVDWIAIDMEPPIPYFKALRHSSVSSKLGALSNFLTSPIRKQTVMESTKKFGEIIDRVHEYGAKTLATVLDLVLFDVQDGRGIMQQVLGTPVTTLQWDLVSPMVYTSKMYEASMGLFNWRDVRYWLYLASKLTKKAFGDRAALSLGAIDAHKPGNHGYFSNPDEMQKDIAAALAGGVSQPHISLYHLEGILRSSQPKQWFEMVFQTTPAVPPRRIKIEALYRLVLEIILPILPGRGIGDLHSCGEHLARESMEP